ncbi:GPP34 family phosphoprotein [Streptomyces sp. NPDC048664]|uniref:GPP34 family phosphoprotein n=1 Tax=Streptomyces sp. NPDC048664 TaxID=3154505 RepID=UPI003436E6BF
MIDDLACLMYLLAYDDAVEGPYDRSRTELLVRAAALIDLASRGRLREDHGTVLVSGTEPTGNPVLDGVLRDASAGGSWKHLLRRHRKRTLGEVEDRLTAAGVLAPTSPPTRFGAARLAVADRAAATAPRARVSAALRGHLPVREIPADAALVALAAAGRIRPIVSRQDRKILRDRIDACTSQLAVLAPGLEKAVRALPTTMIAAQGGMGGS